MFAPLPAPAEMSGWDRAAVALGLPELLLMENASREALHALTEETPVRGKRVLLFMGGGNNGGDAVCLARHLHDAGAEVLVLHSRPLGSYRGVAKKHLWLALHCGVTLAPAAGWPGRFRDTPWDVGAGVAVCERGGPDIVVDGLLGTGFSGTLRPLETKLVGYINALAQRAFIFSLDIPSGLSGMTGRPCPVAVRAHATVTFEAAKPGLVLPEAASYTGRLHVRPIGIPAVVRREHPASFQLVLPEIAEALPQAAPGWHKGSAGSILIVGGSEGLTGAPHLAARAALRSGAGLVSVAAPYGLCRDIKADCPDIMTRPLGPEGNVCWSPALLEGLQGFLPQCRALVLGPGIGRDPETAAFVQALLSCPSRPFAVVDADALHALAVRPEALSSLRACDVLTPHPGEAATLLHTTPARVQADRFEALAGLRRLAPSVWILKGAGTLIGTEGQPMTVAPYAEPNLAVGGSGDVLAGCLGTLMAQTAAYPSEYCEHSSFLAACLAVRLHARAGELLRERFPQRGNTATEIAEMLPQARAISDDKKEWR